MEPLPFAGEHRQRVGAPAEGVWAALLTVLRLEALYGDYERAPYDPSSSPALIAVLRKPPDPH